VSLHFAEQYACLPIGANAAPHILHGFVSHTPDKTASNDGFSGKTDCLKYLHIATPV